MTSDARDPGAEGEALRERLEGVLMERHAALYGHRAAVRRPRRAGLAYAAAAILIVLATLAAMPVSTPHGLGLLVIVDLPPGASAPGQDALLLHLLDARTGAGQASASLDRRADGSTRIVLLAFADHPDPAGLRAGLESAFPALANGAWRMRALEADVRTSLARALGARVFAIEPDRAALDRGRRVVLERLAEHGWKADVPFERADGVRVIEIRGAGGADRGE